MQTMTYAQALTEARQTIVQQQLRIRADAEKVKSQQQAMADQAAAMAEHERRIDAQASELQRLVEESATLSDRMQEAVTAREQSEVVVRQQADLLAKMQSQAAAAERMVAEQAGRIADLTGLLDNARSQLPTREDEAALASMADLLAKRSAALARKAGTATMRLVDDSQPAEEGQAQQAMAA